MNERADGTEGAGSTSQPVRHVAIIMDGNGRWAEQRGLPRHAGHRAGLESVRRVIEVCLQEGIHTLTLFAFSSENWRRPKKEVSLLMDLFLSALQGEVKRMQANDIRLRVIGDRSAFSRKLQGRITDAEQQTRANQGLLLQIAANYGGRWDIAQAARKLCEQVRDGSLAPEQVDESLIASHLSCADQPDPDLFIRTGGERRISNFLLWQCAYTELYFTSRLWPDFDQDAMREALNDYAGRQRRFGKTGAQVKGGRTPVS